MIELRFFGGLTVEETADLLSVSPLTIKDDWRVARARLKRELSRSGFASADPDCDPGPRALRAVADPWETADRPERAAEFLALIE